VIAFEIGSSATPGSKLWGQLSLVCSRWVVQMAKPLNSDLALRARVSTLD